MAGGSGGSSIERITVTLPAGFDPNTHEKNLVAFVSKNHGPGWEIESVNLGANLATMTRGKAMTEVAAADDHGHSFKVRLARGTKPSDGDRQAARLEDANPGYYLTSFEPFLGQATLTRLTDDEARCRGAVAVALGVKPWEVQASSRVDGGFDLVLPKTYQPSKEDKLWEVATSVVGREGWFVTVDARTLKASFTPADPPTFPEAIPTPLERLGRGDVMRTPFGLVLPKPGEELGEEAVINWRASAFALLAGTPGSGKSVAISAILADRVSNGAALAIIDDAAKAVDYLPFKSLCGLRPTGKAVGMPRAGGESFIPTWGCDSLGGAVAVLAMICEEGERRAKVLGEMGLANWLDMPEDQRFQPVFIVADEYEALVAKEPVPKSLPKDHPMRMEAEQANIAHDMIAHFVNRIIKELRFVGMSMLVATQVTNASTGLPPSVKSKMGHFILAGSTPSEPARRQTFPDERAVPRVPANVASGGMVAKGTGSAQIEGSGAFVFKGYYASLDAYGESLARCAPWFDPDDVAPGLHLVDRYLPSLDEDSEGGGRGGKREGMDDPGQLRSPISGKPLAQIVKEMGDEQWDIDPETGKRLSGYERANAARHAVASGGKN